MQVDKFWKGSVIFSLTFGIGAFAVEYLAEEVSRSEPSAEVSKQRVGPVLPIETSLICEKNYRVIPLSDGSNSEFIRSGKKVNNSAESSRKAHIRAVVLDPPVLFREKDTVVYRDLFYREKCASR